MITFIALQSKTTHNILTNCLILIQIVFKIIKHYHLLFYCGSEKLYFSFASFSFLI